MMAAASTDQQWYTLVRFNGEPSNLTGVAQTRTAAEALALIDAWESDAPDDTPVVFDQRNAPIARAALLLNARHEAPALTLAAAD